MLNPTRLSLLLTRPALVVLMLCATACASNPEGDDDEHESEGDDHGHGNEEGEVITTITVSFAPMNGGAAISASFRDADGDGGMSGTTEPLALASGATYTMTVSLLNELDNPPEDITAEVREEALDHQFFFYGSAVSGPAAVGVPDAILEHMYGDIESDYVGTGDLPVGLTNMVTARSAGTGELRLMLRHLPELNGQRQKVPGLAEDLAAGEALPGEVDVDITYDVTVQ
jgi:hypothetical protein